MDNMSSWSSCAFELEDIEIIDHKTEDEEKLGKWHCDQCSLFFLDKGKLVDHKKKHSIQDVVKCKYCQKNISSGLVNKECYVNKKCETCEYKCSKCPQRFLRHSSLINHEKKHNSPKKKRSVNTLKKINCNATENVTVSKGFKRKLEASDVEERNREINLHESVKMKNNSKRKLNNRGKVTLDDQNIPKTSRRLSFKTNKSTEEDLLVKSPKRSTIKNSKCSEEKGFDKANKNTTTVNPQTVSTNPNLSTNENVVNYKPFSCHVCGDTFASDNVLLEHIRTHGENAAKNFKCKFCGDKFGDIYKMQYHLAICPLAEDELESSLKQVIPKNVLIKTSLNSSSPRKRGRPKKIVETTLDGDGEGSKNESTPPSPKRRYVRRRKSEVLESNGAVVHSFEPPLTKQLKTFQNKDKELSCGINRNTLAKNNTDLTVADSVTDVYKESDQDDGKKKIHQCPFPRCDFKFTREKALLCHMRNHSDDFDDSLKCHKCDIPFDDIHALRQHINTCKGIKEEKDDDFHRKDACDVSPNRTFHRSRKEFVCNQCGRSHQSQEKLNSSHQCFGFENGKKTLRTHKCNVCQAEFESELEENDHMVTHTRMVTESLCLRCYNYFNQASLKQHKCRTRMIKSLNSLIELCVGQENLTPKVVAQMFSTPDHKYSAKLKNQNHHNNQSINRLHFCRICHLSFGSQKQCIDHRKSHGKKNRIACACCNKKHSTQKKRERNFKIPIKCSFCQKKVSNRLSLTKHLNEYHHNNLNKFECEICKVTISDASAAIDHFMMHTLKCSVDLENPSCESGFLIDSSDDKNTDKWDNLLRNRKAQSRKLRCRPGFYRGKVIAPKRKYMIGLQSLKLGGKYVSDRKKQTRFPRLKDNSIVIKNGIEYRNNLKGLRNKENIPVNSVIGDTMENSFRKDFTALHKDLVKPCYISLENINTHVSCRTENAVLNKQEEYKAAEKNEQNKITHVLSLIKTEKKANQATPDAKDVILKHETPDNFENQLPDSKVKCESFASKNCKTEDLDDGIFIVEHLQVHKCSICQEIFETIDFLKYHTIVHI